MIFYDLLLLLSLPFVKKKGHHYRRLCSSVPNPNGKKVIWIHAVSVGEVKAAKSLFQRLLASYPDHFFLVTATTEAGLLEASRSLQGAHAIVSLPWDFSWTVRKWVKGLCPSLFLLIETDFWPHLLREIKRAGGKIALVSGKISVRSAKRFGFFTRYSRKLFDLFDLLCIQNGEYLDRFTSFTNLEKLKITGNIKLDYVPEAIDVDFWRAKLSISDCITLSCTHNLEEELLIDALIQEPFCFLLAPRHPERFEKVAQMLESKSIPFVRWSSLDLRTGFEKVVLIDAMGILPICYALSRLSIVGGSFVPGIGGHNILEPCFYSTPVFFWPSYVWAS